MASKGLGTCARQFLLEMDNVHSRDVVRPTDARTTIVGRVVHSNPTLGGGFP